MKLKANLRESRAIVICHGIVMIKDALSVVASEAFANEDPMMVLMEFMRLRNLRLVDLFASLDKDGSHSLTRNEFRNGLMVRRVHWCFLKCGFNGQPDG